MNNLINIDIHFNILPIHSSGITYTLADKGTSLQKNRL